MGTWTVGICLIVLVQCLSLVTSISRYGVKKEDGFDWNANAQHTLKKILEHKDIDKVAKNVILFLGDGMGVSTVTAARWYKSQKEGIPIENTKFPFDEFPSVSLAKTYNTDQITADSAGTATAYLSGVKTKAKFIGVNSKAQLSNCASSKGNELKSILHHSQKGGKWTGVVTTSTIVDATPACAYAHVPDRYWQGKVPVGQEACKDIALQLIEGDTNNDINVILGGGREFFLPDTSKDPEFPNVPGNRTDGRNLILEWQQKMAAKVHANKFEYVQNITEFNKADESKLQYLMGLMNPSKMDYELHRLNRTVTREPSLSEMVTKSVNLLKKNKKGYFLLVEGGRIDHAHHDSYAHLAMHETTTFANAVQTALDMTNQEETLIIVTADHSHAFTLGGYPKIEDNILGLSPSIPEDGKPMLILGYTNGPGTLYHRYREDKKNNGQSEWSEIPRKDLTGLNEEIIADPNYSYDAGIYKESETHGGEEVAVYATGPMAHLLQGVYEQNYIAHVMMYASCVGSNKENCNGRLSNGSSILQAPLTVFIMLGFGRLYELLLLR